MKNYKKNDYDELLLKINAITEKESNVVANLANSCACIYHALENISWCGFYILDNNELVLGPFQGKPACVRIKHGKGVCGMAWKTLETIVVPDVHKFPGHIACDAGANSEIVVPLINAGKCFGVLDLDSYEFDRFKLEDKLGLEKIAKLISKKL